MKYERTEVKAFYVPHPEKKGKKHGYPQFSGNQLFDQIG